ncbi:MAG: hypothetical protein A3G87_00625 [Omnitrophica bacterium RIFCSPLOWO2_12_FULL_50_11]|nr:MAG: hypothetical protein A3G87_00625 [Omnitrophica bacterium RIFCSPLOWO2_12_FULL_50_11]
MCGRYTQAVDLKKLISRFRIDHALPKLPPRYNVAPGQQAPIVLADGGRHLKLMTWGLVPHWAQDPKIGNGMINARAESLTEKPSFRRPFLRSRCLVVADGFYEWCDVGHGRRKVPTWISLSSGEPFAFAGLWDAWRNPAGETIESFTVITTTANDVVRPIHHRMPVILAREAEDHWLDPELRDPDKLRDLLVPYLSAEMRAYEVASLVNSPENDVPECKQPATSPYITSLKSIRYNN